MKLRKISLKDKALLDKYLRLSRHELSAYAFENIYIWKKLFDIRWAIIQESLCVFFQDRLGCFLYLTPQAKTIRPAVIPGVFKIMDGLNKNPAVSRIENVEEKDKLFYKNLGYEVKEKFVDYLCKREDLTRLKGNKFKSKRACVNFFLKHYKFEYLPFKLKDKSACLQLYGLWMKGRQAKNNEPIYQGMLKDSRTCLRVLLDDYGKLNFLGRVVKIKDKTKVFTPLENPVPLEKSFLTGFTFGFELNPETFCILYEITDLNIKGLSQFIFWQFCRELKKYKYINIMDDSGLENLKKVKLSYHPFRLIPAYIVTRKNA